MFRSWAKVLAGGDLLARLHVELDQIARHVDVDGLGVAGLDFQGADHAVRQRQEAERQHAAVSTPRLV